MRQQENTIKKQRVWEIDAYRGYRMLLLLALHLYVTVDEFCINGYYNIDSYAWVNMTDPLHFWFDWGEDGVIYQSFLTHEQRMAWVYIGVAGFFFISGICCSFTRSSINRIAKLFAAGFFVSAFTFGLYLWTGQEVRFIRFGAILCYACCHLIYDCLLKNRRGRFLIPFAILVIVVGYYLMIHPIYTNLSILYPFGFHENGVNAGGYIPIMPYLGWLVLGVLFGKKYYSHRKSRIPIPALDKLTRPLQWIGRHSGELFVAHIVVYTLIFTAVGYIFWLF